MVMIPSTAGPLGFCLLRTIEYIALRLAWLVSGRGLQLAGVLKRHVIDCIGRYNGVVSSDIARAVMKAGHVYDVSKTSGS